MATLTPIATLSSTANASSYNFGSVSVPSDGLLLVCIVGKSAIAVTVSATIDGGSATMIVPKSSSANATFAAIAAKSVSAGSRSIVVSLSGGIGGDNCRVMVYLLTGHLSDTPYDTDANGSDTAVTSRTMTLDFPANGVAVYCAFHGSNTNAISWSAATEDYDASTETDRGGSATKTLGSETAGDTETASWSTNASCACAAAVFESAAASSGNPYHYYQNQMAVVA